MFWETGPCSSLLISWLFSRWGLSRQTARFRPRGREAALWGPGRGTASVRHGAVPSRWTAEASALGGSAGKGLLRAVRGFRGLLPRLSLWGPCLPAGRRGSRCLSSLRSPLPEGRGCHRDHIAAAAGWVSGLIAAAWPWRAAMGATRSARGGQGPGGLLALSPPAFLPRLQSYSDPSVRALPSGQRPLCRSGLWVTARCPLGSGPGNCKAEVSACGAVSEGSRRGSPRQGGVQKRPRPRSSLPLYQGPRLPALPTLSLLRVACPCLPGDTYVRTQL